MTRKFLGTVLSVITVVLVIVCCSSEISEVKESEIEITASQMATSDESIGTFQEETDCSVNISKGETNDAIVNGERVNEPITGEEIEETEQQTSSDRTIVNEEHRTQATVTPKPTRTPDPTNTPTPRPTATQEASATPTPVPTEAPVPTEETIPEATPTPVPTNTPTPTPKPVNDPQYKHCVADVEYWAGPDNCFHGHVYGVPCVRNSAGKWVETGEGEDMVWDAIETEHPDAGGYTTKIVSGSHRNFS